jgi:hypothetical protein
VQHSLDKPGYRINKWRVELRGDELEAVQKFDLANTLRIAQKSQCHAARTGVSISEVWCAGLCRKHKRGCKSVTTAGE